MRKVKEIAVLSVLTIVAVAGLSACGGNSTPATAVVQPSATTAATTEVQATTEATAMVSGPTTVPTSMTEATTAPTTMVEPTAMTQPTTSSGGTTITGPGADLLNKHLQAFKDVKSYHIVQEFETAGQTIKAEGDHQAPDRTRLTLDMAGLGKSETITIGNDSYTKAPGSDSYFHTTTPATAPDPGDMSILPLINSADIVGDETIEGVATTHLKYVFDADKAAAQSGAPTPGAGAMGTVTVEVWIDKATNYPIRQKTVTAAGSTTQTFSKFNEPVNPPIEKPANVSEMPSIPTIEIPTIEIPGGMPEIPTIPVP
jgi:outer membrane lipoprotein-sorting protein